MRIADDILLNLSYSARWYRQQAMSETFDAGDMGCGELLILLRSRMKEMKPGAELQVIARDPGAIEDLPSWCNLVGHKLLKAEHPEYLIQRKGD